ncbi:hypothetical protein FQZ97_946960 [compost metagenome]
MPAARGLLRVPILQELDHDVVELDKPDVETLRATAQIRNAKRAWIDAITGYLNVLDQQQGILNPLTEKIAIAHHFRATKNLSVELERTIHVLHRDTEMLNTSETPPSALPDVAEPVLDWASAREPSPREDAAIPPIVTAPAARRISRR